MKMTALCSPTTPPTRAIRLQRQWPSCVGCVRSSRRLLQSAGLFYRLRGEPWLPPLQMDEGVVETMAHFRAADHMMPGVTSVIDIGGQDMKYLKIKDRAVDSISVNEACSSGYPGRSCKLSLRRWARTFRTSPASPLSPDAPVDLGTRCTVFMNSSVKQAQKRPTFAISPRACPTRSCVTRSTRSSSSRTLRPRRQGCRRAATFLNDSVLRAFELLTTTARSCVPRFAGLMRAYGAALTAKLHDEGNPVHPCRVGRPRPLRSVETSRRPAACAKTTAG